jgi:hypothetical protein
MYEKHGTYITFCDDYNGDDFVEIIETLNLKEKEEINKINFIIFGRHFNKDISFLPQYITKLRFNILSYFDHPVNNLPQSLTHINFGAYFNQPLDNLPKGLIYLQVGIYFNQPLDNLPHGLTNLDLLYSHFNQPLDKLPHSLTCLTIGSQFNQPLDKLPHSLTHLTIGTQFNQPLDKLPHGLTHLVFGKKFNQPLDKLPHDLTYLYFGANFNQPLDKLPHGLTDLYFDGDSQFNQPLSNENLPKSLTRLILGKHFNLDKNIDIDILSQSIMIKVGNLYFQTI